MLNRIWTGIALLALLPVGSTFAQDTCAGGIIVDDGTFENGLSAASSAPSAEYVMRVTPPAGLQRLDRVCVCWTRLGTDPQNPDLNFDLNVYASTADNKPGLLIDTLPAQTATAVPANPAVAFSGYDLSGLAIDVTGPIFVGPKWDPGSEPNFFLCLDQNGGGGEPAFFSTIDVQPPETQAGVSESYRALGIRAQFTQLEAPGPCMPDAKTLCIDDQPGDGRFQVQVAFETTQAGGVSGFGKPTSLAGLGVSRGGLLTFFNDDNPEMLIKVLNACPVNGHYWVFYSAGTNVGLDTTVLDTVTGRSVRYLNPDRNAAAPLQHLLAFPCAGGTGQPLAPSGQPFDFTNHFSMEQESVSTCQPGATTLCIDDQPGDHRFEVEVTFETTQAGGRSGPGMAIPLDSLPGNIRGGLMWFFSADNPEMLIKVLNACSVNGNYWVFYSAGTNVALNTKVTDTATGRVRRYTNSDRTAAPPVQHLLAFNCNNS
jgi:hypothetical protein